MLDCRGFGLKQTASRLFRRGLLDTGDAFMPKTGEKHEDRFVESIFVNPTPESGQDVNTALVVNW
jgi:hypothetical protein